MIETPEKYWLRWKEADASAESPTEITAEIRAMAGDNPLLRELGQLCSKARLLEIAHHEVGGIPVEIVRKDIKNLHMGVYPPAGRVRIAAPLRLDDDAVRVAVSTRLGWIRRRQREFAAQERQSQREMVAGESHYFEGRRYRLSIIEHEGPPSLRIANHSTLQLTARPGLDREGCDAILQRWYRARLRARIPELLEKWQPRIGVQVGEVHIKRMKTRWGSCNAAARRIWLNLELAKKPVACVEYVLVHEMIHLLERQHNDRFRERLDAALPGWRAARAELNRAPLAHEDWTY
ncbi:SprT family zinc-dependent metalloprotease [Thioalkalicoccus limnaeus]|uniref:SprT family zinc-dependent metalloprotease n=1 Tax=Thioalkalicoccus limnaeus TaxID=120681 RepID=A0ABV4B9V1_9GAMM